MLISAKYKIFDVDLYGILAAVALGIVAWMFVVQPLDNKLDQCLRQQQQSQQDAESASVELTHLREQAKHQQTVTEQLSRTPDILRKNTGISDVLKKIGQFAHLAGLRLDETTLAADTATEHYRKINLSLRLNGTFPDLQVFLNHLASQLPYVRVQYFTANIARQANDGICDIDIVLDIFAPREQ